ncbi:SICAvar, type I (fragment) [Plasmodium knowlesi strain H]|uniref:SICAvar, type I n=1 Tax=Plasmodium knowlesi (strain H) TaxID=5851 RepID=A0A1A7W049_PLAKH
MHQNGRNGQTECNTLDNPSDRAACNFLHAGLDQLYDATAPPASSSSVLDNPSLRQTMGCFLLHAYAKYMKGKAICDIEKGISKAFELGKKLSSDTTNCNGSAKGRGPCVPCQWQESDYDKCQININSSTTPTKTAKDKVKEMVEGTDPDTNSIIDGINKMKVLCEHMECIASHLNSTNGKPSNPTTQNFWAEGGDVELLWKDLSNAMTNNGSGGTECDNMDDNGGRKPTNPEKKACQYLTAGFKKLKELTSTGATKINTDKILDKDPSLKRAMGCFLLHAYAKKMKGEAKCEIEAGIEKAFKNAGSCNGVASSRTGPCVPCQWDEGILNTCKITTNGTSKEVENKLNEVQDKITETVTHTKENINKTESLCEKLQCAAAKWFKNNSTTSNGITTPTKNWCDFWEKEGIKPELNSMFGKIESAGKETNAVCEAFGDNNPESVERKACNHIAAGLQHIKEIPNDSGGIPNDQLLQQAVGCIALNMYADKIIELTKTNCPIDESKIKEMFNKWNKENNNSSCPTSGSGGGANTKDCFVCDRVKNSDFSTCKLSVSNTLIKTSPQDGSCPLNNNDRENVKTELNKFLKDDDKSKSISQVKETLSEINKMGTFCSELQCAARKWNSAKGKTGTPSWDTLSTITNMSNSFCTQLQCAAKKWKSAQNKNISQNSGQSADVKWAEINKVVESELTNLLKNITNHENWKQNEFDKYCNDVGSSSTDTKGEITAKQKACKLFASGLDHISKLKDNNGDGPLKQTMMCAALNLYADQLINKATDQCPLDNEKLKDAIEHAFKNSNATKNSGNSCTTQGPNFCFECKRQDSSTFGNCQIGKNQNDKVKPKLDSLLEKNDETNPNNKEKTLDKINEIKTFCTQVQCAIKQHYRAKNGQTLPNGIEPSWENIEEDATNELTELIKHMTKEQTEGDLAKYCNNDAKWYKLGHKESKTNKAACLLFAAGLQHIYTHDNGRVNARVDGRVNGPSFGQTMGCLFLKEYAKQLKKMAEEKRKGNSWVHPHCSIKEGIEYAFGKSNAIMNAPSQCDKNGPNSCFECKWDENDYDNCSIGSEKVQEKVKPMFEDDLTKQTHLQQTLENTVCPILLTDLLTPFLPLAPVSIGLSAMAYYLWKYFGPLGKGGPRFRRSPAEIPGPSVQEQVLDHVEEAGPHEYRLVKERKPRSAPTRTKRSGPVNRRTIIEIHFEVLDECQKGDTQLNQKDFMELLVQEFMGSEFMEEEHVPMEEVLMEGVPLEQVPVEEVPMERVPHLGSGFMV